MIGWICLGVLGLVLLIPVFGYFNLFGFHLGYSQEEKPKCLEFSDGKLAVVRVGEFASSMAWGGVIDLCDGHADTVAWFLNRGYNITAVTQYEVYLRR